MKARTSSQVLAGLLCAATVWLLSLLTSVLGIPSWKDGVGYVNNCRNVCSLMMSSCVIFGHFQMINTHTLLPQCCKDEALTTKCHLRDGVWKHLCFCRCFHTFSRAIVLSSCTRILTHTHTHTQRFRLHSCSIQSRVERYSILRTVTLWCWLDTDLLETTQNTLQTT